MPQTTAEPKPCEARVERQGDSSDGALATAIAVVIGQPAALSTVTGGNPELIVKI
jgi:hypothetical protein